MPHCLQAGSFVVATAAPHHRNLECVYREPRNKNEAAQILLLVGGRNWEARRTLTSIPFVNLEKKYNLLAVAASFKDDDYWRTENGSSQAIAEMIKRLSHQYKVKKKILMYGYSAGAQLTASFALEFPHMIHAWALHANGVWWSRYEDKVSELPQGFASCGVRDEARFTLSQGAIQNARERGAKIVFSPLRGGHELSPLALQLAEAYFEAILAGGEDYYAGDDQTLQIIPWANREGDDEAALSFLPSFTFVQLWKLSQER